MTFVPREAGGNSLVSSLCIHFMGKIIWRWGIASPRHTPRSTLPEADFSSGKHMSVSTQLLEVSGKHWGWIVWPAITCGLVVLLYAPVLRGLGAQWSTDPDYSYGFFVPVFSAYALWWRRGRLTTGKLCVRGR